MRENPPSDRHSPAGPLYADIIVPRHLARSFTYLVPGRLKRSLRVGHCVLVPFGRSKVQGAVISLTHAPSQEFSAGRLKEIGSIVKDNGLGEIPSHLFKLAKQVSDYYIAPWGQCLRLVLPPSRTRLTRAKRSSFTVSGQSRLAQGQHSEAVIPSVFPASDTVDAEWQERLSLALKNRRPAKFVLQAPQADRLAALRHAIVRTLAERRSAVVIVGETDRAQWLADALAKVGTLVSACLHSGLSDDERVAIWQQARRPDPQVVVGTRSAVFLPFPSLGMVWIERDEDPALKEPQEPRFHARDVAWMRACNEGALVVLGSAHPFLDAVVSARTSGTALKLAPQIEAQPQVELVDLRPLGTGTAFSPRLIEAAREAIDRHAGVLLFLNRKNYARALVCRDCGQVPRCESCRVALAYSRRRECLFCSYCGMSQPLPRTCVACAGHRLHLIGEGTERVEEEMARLFPNATIMRVDRDTMRTPAQAAAQWNSIKAGRWDVLIGTQLLLRNYVVPPVGVVGAVQADASLSLPDFRAAERTYHLLREVCSLAKPAGDGGRVIIQSYLPSHHAIQAVARQDESIFTSEELFHRTALGYPPAVHLIALQVSGAAEQVVEEAAQVLSAQLQTTSLAPGTQWNSRLGSGAGHEFVVLGPVPPPIPKVRGRYHRQVLVKSTMREPVTQAVQRCVQALERRYPARAVKFNVDVDPVEMW